MSARLLPGENKYRGKPEKRTRNEKHREFNLIPHPCFEPGGLVVVERMADLKALLGGPGLLIFDMNV